MWARSSNWESAGFALQRLRVRLPPCPPDFVCRDVGKLGNPLVLGTRDRRFKSSHPDQICPEGAAAWAATGPETQSVVLSHGSSILPPSAINRRQLSALSDRLKAKS